MRTRVEVLDGRGDLMGFFLAGLPLAECRGREPAAFVGVPGEWWPAGGCGWQADGPLAWHAHAAAVGEMREVSRDRP